MEAAEPGDQGPGPGSSLSTHPRCMARGESPPPLSLRSRLSNGEIAGLAPCDCQNSITRPIQAVTAPGASELSAMEAGARGPGQEPRRPGRLCRSVGEKGSAGPGQAGLGGASARPKRFSSTAPPFASVGPGATRPPSARTSSTPKAAGEDAGRLALRRHRTQRRVARCGRLAPAAHRAGRHQPEGRHVPGPAPSTARSPVTGLREEPESRRRRGTPPL